MADPDQDLDIELIKKRTISGIVTFTLRSFFIQAFTFLSTFILTILLDPSVFGVFFLVSALINLFVYFSDIGLAAALIQDRKEPKRVDFVTTFTIQQIIVLFLVALGILLSGKIAAFYKLDTAGLLLLRVLIFSLLLSSLKTIPSIILERNLNFAKLVIPQLAENIIFYGLAVILAFLNFGLYSFTWAVLTRGIVGLVIIYILSPWRPALSINKDSAKRLMTFGIPFQLNSILALIKDDLLIVFIGKILPYNQVGYIGWAQKFAFVPLRFFMDNVIKVPFPAYSRLQQHKEELVKGVEKSLFFVTFLVYPCAFGLLAVAQNFVHIIPKYGKWEPALPLLYFFAINAIFASVNTTLTNTLFALGKSKIVLNLMIVWTALTWVLTYLLVKQIGFVGVGVASALVAMSTSVVVFYVKKHIPISVGRNIFGPFVMSLLMFAVVKGLGQILPLNVFGLLMMIIFGVLTYFILSTKMLKNNIFEEVKIVLKAIRT